VIQLQLDYHYYTVYQLAKLAGFGPRDSETIAYASQYVDDSTESEPVEPFPDQHFDTVRTAHYNLGAFDWNVQKKIYMPFHFLPTSIRWESPKDFSYVTKPATDGNTDLATMLIDDAVGESNKRFRLIRLGVALHTIADTFSHFGFSGRHHGENKVGKIWLAKTGGGWKLEPVGSFVGDVFLPSIGHVEALNYPDQPFLKWRYTDRQGNIKTRNNRSQSINGAKLIYHRLKFAKSSSAPSKGLDQDHPQDFKRIASLFSLEGDLDIRCAKWKTYTKAPDYDKTKWRKAALKGDVRWDDLSGSERKVRLRKLQGKPDFDNSRWAYFHRAALKQRGLVLGWIN